MTAGTRSETARSMLGSRRAAGPWPKPKFMGPWTEVHKHGRSMDGVDEYGWLMADNNDAQAVVKECDNRAK